MDQNIVVTWCGTGRAYPQNFAIDHETGQFVNNYPLNVSYNTMIQYDQVI